MRSPFFTVAITTHNRSALLAGAIESVLAQTFFDYELCILDDASTDNTEKVIQEFIEQSAQQINATQITQWRAPTNAGISALRSQAIRLARGQFIAYLDDDDRFAPDYLHHAHAALSTAPTTVGFAITSCHVYRVFKDADSTNIKLLRAIDDGCQEATVYPGQGYFQNARGCSSGLIVRTNTAQDVGEWANIGSGEDTEYMMRMATKWDYMIIPESIAIIYNHPGIQITKNRYMAGRSTELLADVYEKELKNFPLTYQNYYLVATSMYYGNKSYRDGIRTFIKAVKVRPQTLNVWKVFIILHIRILRPNAYAHRFKLTRQDM